MILLQDNTRLYTAKKTLKTISDLGWGILSHVMHSPYLVPSNYHLFRFLQHHLTDSQFKSVEQVEKSFDVFIELKPPSFFQFGIRQLAEK